MTLDIQRARELLARATPGPWETASGADGLPMALVDGGGDQVADCNRGHFGDRQCEANAALIAAAPTLLASFVEEIARLRAEVEQGDAWEQVARERHATVDRLTRERDEARAENASLGGHLKSWSDRCALAEQRAERMNAAETRLAMVEAELSAARVEIEAMRAVVEAATTWNDTPCDCEDEHDIGSTRCGLALADQALMAAADNYRARAAKEGDRG